MWAGTLEERTAAQRCCAGARARSRHAWLGRADCKPAGKRGSRHPSLPRTSAAARIRGEGHAVSCRSRPSRLPCGCYGGATRRHQARRRCVGRPAARAGGPAGRARTRRRRGIPCPVRPARSRQAGAGCRRAPATRSRGRLCGAGLPAHRERDAQRRVFLLAVGGPQQRSAHRDSGNQRERGTGGRRHAGRG